jgi:hypothetical protein
MKGVLKVPWIFYKLIINTWISDSLLIFSSFSFAGSYCHVATAVMQMVQQSKETGSDPDSCLPVDDINSLFLELAPKCPMLMFKWCYLLTLVNFGDQTFWAKILRTQPHDLILDQGYYKIVFLPLFPVVMLHDCSSHLSIY